MNSKHHRGRGRGLAVILILSVILILAYHVDVHPRAGRGGSYRSGGGSRSSSYKSYSSPSRSYGSGSRSYSSPSKSYTPYYSGSRSSGSRSYYGGSTYSTYSHNYEVDSYTANLRVNRDGTVDVREVLDVNMKESAFGIVRYLYTNGDQYNNWKVTDYKTSTGKISYYSTGDYLHVGNPKKRVKGKQKFEMSYRIKGAVIPYSDASVLAWRSGLGKIVRKYSVKVSWPGLKAGEGDVLIISSRYGDAYAPVRLAPVKGGAEISAASSKILQTHENIEIYIPFASGSLDGKQLDKTFGTTLSTYEENILKELILTARINEDRTVNVKADYSFDLKNFISNMVISLPKEFRVADPPLSPIWNKYQSLKKKDLYYVFQQDSCEVRKSETKYNAWGFCMGRKKSPGSFRYAADYLLYGNNLDEKEDIKGGDFHYFDFLLPSVKARHVEKISLNLKLPSFVSRDKVRVDSYLVNPWSGKTLRPFPLLVKWEGDTLSGVYTRGLWGDQSLRIRVFVPARGFSYPGFFRMTWLYFAHNHQFDVSYFWTLIVLIGLLLLGAGFVARKVLSGRGGVNAGTGGGFKAFAQKSAAIEEEHAELLPKVKAIQDTVQKEDPAFLLEPFYKRSGEVFLKLQEAWSKGDMMPVRNFISQGVYSRYRLQLDLMLHDEKLQNLMSDCRVNRMMAVGVDTSQSYHTLHVKLNASARDITVPVTLSDQEKQKRAGKADVITFTEIYSFTRKRGVHTDPTKNLLAGQCPNCGYIPDNFGESNKCQSCGSVYNSGEYDWVLSEITQEEEWEESSWDEIDGLKELETKNVSINREVIEDRASYLFWRWLYARARGRTEALRRDATEGYLSSFTPDKTHLAEPAVGAVDLQRCWQEGDHVHAQVRIFWSASFRQGEEPQHKEHDFTLSMPVNLKNEFGLAEPSCPSCGGPLPETDATECQYCGSPLPQVNNNWLLEGLREV